VTQAEAGLAPELFRAVALVYADLAGRPVTDAPEDVADDMPLADVLARLDARGAGRGGARRRA
jgi:hypothetical protein